MNKVPLCVPYIGTDGINAVSEVLKSGWYTYGPKNEEFEKSFAEYIGCKYAVSVNSWTSIAYLVIRTLEINGEIILPSFTFVASANVILNAGATPIFADIEYDSCNIDPVKIEEKITNKTEAIMPVHFAGQSCKMDRIMAIAKKYNLAVIEDSAEAIGAEYRGKKTGSFGIGCFSFFPTKNMTTGEGGMLTTDDSNLADRVRTLAAHGISHYTFAKEKQRKPWFRAAIEPGYNFRMPNILAALGVEQLKKVEHMNRLRRKHARYLNNNLPTEYFDLPISDEECSHTYQMYTVKVKNMDRNKFVLKLREKGIDASVHFDPPVHLQPAYEKLGYGDDYLPVTQKVVSSIITLPMFPGLEQSQLDLILEKISETIRELT